MNEENPTTAITPFERIRRTNPTGSEFWSSRDFAQVLGYTDYRNFEAVIEKARTACFNSGQRVEDHFVEITEMVEIGSGAQRPIRTVMMSRYACYLVIQNVDPAKEIVAVGQTYFAVQTRRQEVSDMKSEPKSAGPSKNWAAQCLKTCRWRTVSKSLRPIRKKLCVVVKRKVTRSVTLMYALRGDMRGLKPAD